MILVSIGIDGNTVIESSNIKRVFRKGNYGNTFDPDGMIGNLVQSLRTLENSNISKLISLATASKTPDNAVDKIKNIIYTYNYCTGLYKEKASRILKGEEQPRDVIKSFFYSEDANKGMYPITPAKICSDHFWERVRGYHLFEKFDSIPRILSVDLKKDFEIGSSRFLSIEASLGFCDQLNYPLTFTEVHKHSISLALEKVDG